MKVHQLACLTGSLLLAASLVSAQIVAPTEASLDQNPFGNGSFSFGSWSGLDLVQTNMAEPGTTLSKVSKFGIGIYPMYFPVNNVGVGINLNALYKDSKIPEGNSENKDTRWMAGVDLLYGIHFTRTFNLYAHAGVSFGQKNMTTISPTEKSNSNYNLLDYNFSVGAPLHLGSEGQLYFTPYVSYNVLNTSITGEKEVDSRFDFGIKMETWIDDLFDKDLMSKEHWDFYSQGSSAIDLYSDRWTFNDGTDKTTYADGGFTGGSTGGSTRGSTGGSSQSQNLTSWSFCGGYNYFFVNYFSGGIRAGIGGGSENYGWSTGTTTKFGWIVGPEFELHVPVENPAHNIYLFGEYQWGSDKMTSGTGIHQTTTKENSTHFNAGVGYDFHFTTHMVLSPQFGYRVNNTKETAGVSIFPIMGTGFGLDFGLKYYIP